MNQLKKHIAFKIVGVLLVAALLIPTGAKFAHIFKTHKHVFCTAKHETHLHNYDFDCQFYKFHVNANFTLPDFHFNIPEIFQPCETIEAPYVALIEHEDLHFSLRAPPNFI
ncbi:hypothetical protein [Gaetbulibacter aestuarii]|uniref:Uncharacterized protein n=1 Tax=Gaetbulibacter aestuarii TaxID=1502358 RepID=A0ABW7N2C1_9FLAO